MIGVGFENLEDWIEIMSRKIDMSQKQSTHRTRNDSETLGEGPCQLK